MRRSLLIASLLFACLPASATPWTNVVPNPATSSQTLRFNSVLPHMSCFSDVTTVQVERVPGGARVTYTAAPNPTAICFTVMPPLDIDVELGRFEPGEYRVELVGNYQGAPDPIVIEPFRVVAGTPAGPHHPVPAGSTLTLLLTAAALWSIARLRLRS
jgi:hypothetical protein